MTKNHGFYYLWSVMMIGLNFGVVVVAVVLGWLYLFLRLVLYFLTIYLLFIIIGIFDR